MDLWRHDVFAVRRPPCAVRRPPCAVRRSLCNSETPGPIYLRFGTNTHWPNTPRRNFQIFGTEPQKNILDQKLTKMPHFTFCLIEQKLFSLISCNLAQTIPVTLHARAHLA